MKCSRYSPGGLLYIREIADIFYIDIAASRLHRPHRRRFLSAATKAIMLVILSSACYRLPRSLTLFDTLFSPIKLRAFSKPLLRMPLHGHRNITLKLKRAARWVSILHAALRGAPIALNINFWWDDIMPATRTLALCRLPLSAVRPCHGFLESKTISL